jgi:hypothetical protein
VAQSIRVSNFISIISDGCDNPVHSTINAAGKAKKMTDALRVCDVMILEAVKFEAFNSNGTWFTKCLLVNKGFK